MATQAVGYAPKNGIIANDGDGGTAGPMKTANTAIDGSGTLNTLLTAGTNGSAVMKIRFTSAGANVPTLARIFIYNGTKTVLWNEVPLPTTPAINNTAPSAINVDTMGPANLVGSGKVYITLATSVSGGWYASAEYGDW